MRIFILILVMLSAVIMDRANASNGAELQEIKAVCMFRAEAMAHAHAAYLADVPLWQIKASELALESEWFNDTVDGIYDGIFFDMRPQEVFDEAYSICITARTMGVVE